LKTERKDHPILYGTAIYDVNEDALTNEGWYVEKGSAVYGKCGLKPGICFVALPQIPTSLHIYIWSST